MSAGQDLVNAANGAPPGGPGWPWRWVRVRARTVYGNLKNNKPFNYPNPTYAATTSEYDVNTGSGEVTAWRYVDSRQDTSDSWDNVVDPKDIMLVWWENFLATTDPKTVAALVAKAKQLRKWPTNYPGTPDFEKGQ
jgi:hypothetical protein